MKSNYVTYTIFVLITLTSCKLKQPLSPYSADQLKNAVLEGISTYYDNDKQLQHSIKRIINPDGYISFENTKKFDEEYYNAVPIIINIVINDLSPELKDKPEAIKENLDNIRNILAQEIYTQPKYIMMILYEIKSKTIIQVSDELNFTNQDLTLYISDWKRDNGEPLSNENHLIKFIRDIYDHIYDVSGYKKLSLILIIVFISIFVIAISIGIFCFFKLKY